MKFLISVCLMVSALALSSCGAVADGLGVSTGCTRVDQVQDKYANATLSEGTRGQQIEFCIGGQNPHVVSVSMMTGPQDPDFRLYLESKEITSDKGTHHLDGACNDIGRAEHATYVEEVVPVALTSSSFGAVKLCYYDSSKTRIALSMASENEPCPAGSTAQIAPVNDCSQLAK